MATGRELINNIVLYHDYDMTQISIGHDDYNKIKKELEIRPFVEGGYSHYFYDKHLKIGKIKVLP